MGWKPPGKNCGACGARTCGEFMDLLSAGHKTADDCPFSGMADVPGGGDTASTADHDIHGRTLDFVLGPLPGEPSARKIVLPFRADLVERWEIAPGDHVLGRPMGQGCPVQHVLRVLDANTVTGVLTCHTVGPLEGRKHPVQDLQAYHVVGFEGMAQNVQIEPVFGKRHFFLPSYCMMNLGHTGVVMMVLRTSAGLHLRIEDIRVL